MGEKVNGGLSWGNITIGNWEPKLAGILKGGRTKIGPPVKS